MSVEQHLKLSMLDTGYSFVSASGPADLVMVLLCGAVSGFTFVASML